MRICLWAAKDDNEDDKRLEKLQRHPSKFGQFTLSPQKFKKYQSTTETLNSLQRGPTIYLHYQTCSCFDRN